MGLSAFRKGETANAAIDMRGRLLGLPAELRLPRLRGERRPAFWQEAMEAYEYRLKGLETPGVCFLVGEHG